MVCSKSGKENEEQAKFCQECSNPLQNESSCNKSQTSKQKFPIIVSWKPLAFFFGALGIPIGRNLARLMGFTTAIEAGLTVWIMAMTFSLLGLFIGYAIVKVINGINKTKQFKLVLVWSSAVIGFLFYLAIHGITSDAYKRLSPKTMPFSQPRELIQAPHQSLPIMPNQVPPQKSSVDQEFWNEDFYKLSDEQKQVVRDFPEFWPRYRKNLTDQQLDKAAE